LESGMLPSDRKKSRHVIAVSEDFILVDDVLFRVLVQKNSDDILKITLCIPREYVDTIFHLYHESFLGSHMGIRKTYVTLRQKFYIVNLFHRLKSYIESCHACARSKPLSHSAKQIQSVPRIPAQYLPMQHLHGDIQYLPRSNDGYLYNLVLVCDTTKFTICIPLKNKTSSNIGENILQRFIFLFGCPLSITFDEDKSLSSSVMKYICQVLKIDMRIISVASHQSNLAERQIRTISGLIKSQLTGMTYWNRFTGAIAFAYNSFISDSHGYSPFYLVFLREPHDLTSLPTSPDNEKIENIDQYVSHLQERFDFLSKFVTERKTKYQIKNYLDEAKSLKPSLFKVNSLVYLLSPSSSDVNLPSRKYRADYCGPFRIAKQLDSNHFILTDLQGRLVKTVVHIRRLKLAKLRISSGVVTSDFDKLKTSMNANKNVQRGEKVSVVCDDIMSDAANINTALLATDVSIDEVQTDLSEYLTYENMQLACLCDVSNRQAINVIRKHGKMFDHGESLILVRCRYYHGKLQVLLRSEKSHISTWFDINEFQPSVASKIKNLIGHGKLRCIGSFRTYLKMLGHL